MSEPPRPPNLTMPVVNKQVQLFRDQTDQPQYVCTEVTCGKRFGRKEHLARHMRAHANDKPYKCPEENCDGEFTRSDLLKRHIETKHPPPTPPGSSPKRHLFSEGGSRYKKPRTTNACRGCADSKVKCDGVTPVCGRCRRRERDCVWTRPKDPSPRMKSLERLSDGSITPTTAGRRNSDQMSIVMDHAHRPSCEDTPMTDPSMTGFANANLPPPAQQEFHPGPQLRPQFTPVLSFSSSSSSPLSNAPYKSSFDPTPSNLGVHSTFAQPEPKPHLSRSQSNSLIEVHGHQPPQLSQASATAEFNSYSASHSAHFQNSVGSTTSYVQHPEQYGPSQYGYQSNFYTPQQQADNALTFESNNMAWAMDNQFEIPSQGLSAFNPSLDLLPMQWTENFENMLAEGLEVNDDKDTPSTPSVEEDREGSQLVSPLVTRPAPTSHPALAPSPIPANKPAEPKPQRAHSEYLGYEYWDQRDMHGAVENMEVLKATNILLQETARKLRATTNPWGFGNQLSNIRLTEDKRDDIKSMLDDTNAHSRLMHPSKHAEAQRLPRLEIFNILLKSYFHNFHAQHPIFHLPSIIPRDGHPGGLEKKKDILLYAMCCAGAFRHAARPIQEYARGMQELLRRTISYHFEKDPRHIRDLQSMQAWHLCLFIGGWSGSARASESSQAFCGALNSMLRCGHYFDGQRGDWYEEDLRPVAPGEETERWRMFVECEEKKRLIFSQLWFECHMGSFMRVRPTMTYSELTLPVMCEMELWRAETAEDWAKLWNHNLNTRLPRGDHELFEPSVIGALRQFAKLSSDFTTVAHVARQIEYGRHLPSLLMGIHSLVVTISENRSCVHWDSRAINAGVSECNTMLNYWWAVREACHGTTAAPVTTEWLEFSSNDINVDCAPDFLQSLDITAVLFHFTAMMLHIPLREIRLMNERNYLPIRKMAATRLWRSWKDTNRGENARLGLWHAGQIIRYARIMINNDTGPLWLAPMVAEAANVMWSYAALIRYDDQIQRGKALNGEYLPLDSDDKWNDIPVSARNHGVPSITNRQGEVIPLTNARAVVTECAEMLNRGPLGKKSKHARGKTILDEQFITQLDKLVKFGNIEFLIAGLQESSVKK